MITLDVKFPQASAKITSATNTYNVTKTYFPYNSTTEVVTDDILSEIKRKGKYTSKSKSDENGGFTKPIKVFDGNVSDNLVYPLVLERYELYKNYYGFTVSGRINPQDNIGQYVDNGIIKNIRFYYYTYTDGNITEYDMVQCKGYEQLEYYIDKQVPVILKDLIIRVDNGELSFKGDIYIYDISQFYEYYVSFEYNGEKYHLEQYSPQDITIIGENLDFLGLSFSGSGYSYPPVITTKENVYQLDDNTIFIKDLNKASSFKFGFAYWNTPNSEIVINDIFTTETNVNRTNLISAESNLSYRADKKMPSFGILSNTGNLEFNDIDGRIKLFAENNMLKSDVRVQLFLKNTLTNTQEQIGNLYTDVWNYDNDNRQVSVSLKDGLEELQDITPTEKLEYDPRNPKSLLLRDIYTFLWQRTPRKYGFITYGSLDETTKDIMLNTVINYPLIEQGTLWQMWTKLCEVGGLYIYKQADGLTRCSYTYGG